VAIYCKEGRIKGAVLRGRMWLIPADAEKLDDHRRSVKWDWRRSRMKLGQ